VRVEQRSQLLDREEEDAESLEKGKFGRGEIRIQSREDGDDE